MLWGFTEKSDFYGDVVRKNGVRGEWGRGH